MRRPFAHLLILLSLLALALPAAAHAGANATDYRIIRDCQLSDSGLNGSYSKHALSHALHNLDPDQLQYSGCYDVIRQELFGQSGSHGAGGPGSTGAGAGPSGGGAGGTSGGSGAVAGAPGEAAAGGTTSPHAGAKAPVEVAGTPIAPGTLPSIGHDAHELPTALVVLLALLALVALATALMTIGRRVVARRRA